MRLLVAEADTSLAEFLQTRLQQEHFAVQLASTGDQISKFAEKSLFDLILLDLNLPVVPGHDYLRQLQSHWPEAPVVLLSHATTVEERVKGLDAGADDIIVKPFAWSELAARIRAVLRRRNRPAREVFQFEDLEVNRVSHEVRRAGRAVELSPKEYALLEFLLRNPGHPVTRAAIIEAVWRIHGDSITNVVDVYINYLRRKIDSGADHPLIRTIRGVGYQIGGNHRAGSGNFCMY
jgi:two-component system copper resistance phosphate regulon response regulator CusR